MIKVMHGIKEEVTLARQKIKAILKPFGYYPDKLSPNIWYHTAKSAKLILCVDAFGVKYYSKDDAEQSKAAFKQVYVVTPVYSGTDYYGLKLQWDYIS